MNFRLLLRNITLHALAALFLTAAGVSAGFPWALTHPYAAILSSVLVTGLLMLFIYEPLRRALQPFIDRALFGNQFSYLEALGQIPNDLLEFTNLREMLDYLVTRLTEAAKLERVRVFMHDPGQQNYAEMIFRGSSKSGKAPVDRPALPENMPLIKWVREKSQLWTLEELGEEAQDLRDLGGVACFPINKEKELLGLVVLGPKRSGEPFNQVDLKVLRALRKKLENFLTQAMVLTQEALNMVKDSHDMKNDVNALNGRVSWRAMRLASWWMDFERETGHFEKWLHDPATQLPASDQKMLAFSLKALKQSTTDFYADAKRGHAIEEHALSRLSHHLRNWAEFGRVVAEGFRGRRLQEAVDVGHTARLCVDRWKPMAEKKHLQLTVNVPTGLVIWGERGLLEQIIENLIDNAVKATTQGFVQVSARREQQEILIEVRDSGCGVSDADLSVMFQKPFFPPRARRNLEQGTGIGLYLVSQYARSLGGRAAVESQLGKGSTFRVILPVHAEERETAAVV